MPLLAFPQTLAAPEGKSECFTGLRCPRINSDKEEYWEIYTYHTIQHLTQETKMSTQKTGKHMYTGAFFIKTPNWNKLKCLTTAKQFYIFKNEIRSVTKKCKYIEHGWNSIMLC